MKILFLTRHYWYLRSYEAAILELAARGHQLHLAADREESLGGRAMVGRWAAAQPLITVGWTPDRESDTWFWLATRLRQAQDYLRYLDRRYDAASQLRVRAEERLPMLGLLGLKALGCRFAPLRRLLSAGLDVLERSIPPGKDLTAFMREQAPDLVLLTPLVELGSPQLDHLRAAQAAGVPTALCVGSWDHLSSKALIKVRPDRVFLWNETQKAEATELHGVPAASVVVTGGQCFDQWFERSPTLTRDAFCRQFGFDPSRPIILWVGSSLFRGGPPESDLAETWVQGLRAHGEPVVRDVNILVRPHPQRADSWRHVDFSEYGHVAIRTSSPTDDEGRGAYFDALYHSAAVVGINTSAMIEAAIVGRPVLSIVDPALSHNQAGTLHWSYLSTVAGGMVLVGANLTEHLGQLADVLTGRLLVDSRDFVEAFVRPFGLEVAATPKLVAAIEELSTTRVRARTSGSWLSPALRLLLLPIVWLKRARREWGFIRKRIRRSTKIAWHAVRRSMRQGLKMLVLRRLRSEQPQVIMSKPDRMRVRAQNLFDNVDEVQEAKEALTRLAQGGKPILIGPWLSETGFELLYWIPFLHWAKTYANFRDDRLRIISRGGCASWYQHITTNYHDVFDFYGPDEFRERNEARILEQRGNQKHTEVSAFDREIIDRATKTAGLTSADVLHPSLMYKLFRIFWRLQASVGLVQGFTVHRKLTAPPLGDLAAHLPEHYVAVKFYKNAGFPDAPANQAFVADHLRRLSATHHVIVLNTGMRFDEHGDYDAVVRERVHTIDHLMTPRNNLDVQTRVIAGADAFVGTYGGFSYLAPLLGVDTLAFYSDATAFRIDHLEIAKRVFADLNTASFIPLDVHDLDVLRVALGVGTDGWERGQTPAP